VESEVDSEVDSEEEVTSEVSVESEDEETLPDLNEVPSAGNSRVKKTTRKSKYKPGELVVATYEGSWFLCEVCEDQERAPWGYTRLSYTIIKGKNAFAWGDKPDILLTANEDILMQNVSPVPINSRGHLALTNPNLLAVMAKMVMVFFLLLQYFSNRQIFYNLIKEKFYKPKREAISCF